MLAPIAPTKPKPVLIKGHSWYGLTAHIYRVKTNKVIKGTIRDIVLEDGFVALDVSFKENKKNWHNNYCPTYLMNMNFLHYDASIVTDEEEEEDNTKKTTPLRPTEPLPEWLIYREEESRISPANLKALQWIAGQTEQLRKLRDRE